MVANVLHRVQMVGVKQDDSQFAAYKSGSGSEARWQPMSCIVFRWWE